MTKTFKIVRGTYLTGLGQEPSAYYFKVSESDDCSWRCSPDLLSKWRNYHKFTSFGTS